MPDENSPLPEFSELLRKAASVTDSANREERRRAMTSLIDFVREYDGIILDKLSDPS